MQEGIDPLFRPGPSGSLGPEPDSSAGRHCLVGPGQLFMIEPTAFVLEIKAAKPRTGHQPCPTIDFFALDHDGACSWIMVSNRRLDP